MQSATKLEISSFANLFVGKPKLTNVILCSGAVKAVTSLGNQLFAIRENSKEIDVYDSTTFNQLPCLQIQGGSVLLDLAACDFNNCLYVGLSKGYFSEEVRRLSMPLATPTLTLKPEGGTVGSLSVNSSHNLLICSRSQVEEYTPSGYLVRMIPIADASHVSELPNRTLAVSEFGRNSDQGFRIVDADGKILYSLSEIPELNNELKVELRGFVVDKQGFILAADYRNNRLLILNPILSDVRPILLPMDTSVEPLKQPHCLSFDESRGRLYVGENGGQNRLLIFNKVIPFAKFT